MFIIPKLKLFTRLSTFHMVKNGLSTATIDKSFLACVNDVPSNHMITSDRISKLTNEVGFTHKKGDVWLVTYPKCGTTWAQGICKLLLGHDQDTWRYDAVPWPEIGDPAYGKIYHTLEQIDEFPSPRIFKSHWPSQDHVTKNGISKYIYIERDPLDVVVSFYHHTRAYKILYDFDGDFDDFFECFLNGNVDFGDYFEHVRGWWNRKNDTDVLWISYEEMSMDIHSVVRKIANFIGVELNDEDVSKVVQGASFKTMKELESPALNRKKNETSQFRKGIVGDYANYCNEMQISRMKKRFNDVFADTRHKAIVQ